MSRGDPNQRSVYLTFDAGSDAGFTAQILDSLKAQGVYATFGLTGLWAQQNPDLVRRIAGDGHLVINHTYDHRSFTGVSTHSAPLSAPERTTEIEHAEAVLTALTGQTTKPWFRPPYGDFDASVTADAMAAGYDHVALWTVDSLGWQGLSVPAIQQRCLTRAVPGAIYLFHVGSQSHDAQALPAIIDSLRVQNYSFATMAALATQR